MLMFRQKASWTSAEKRWRLLSVFHIRYYRATMQLPVPTAQEAIFVKFKSHGIFEKRATL